MLELGPCCECCGKLAANPASTCNPAGCQYAACAGSFHILHLDLSNCALTSYAIGVYWIMVFIETPTFTRLIASLLDDEEYSKLQDELVRRPDAGDLIRDGGGIRKLRWKRQGTGKSGGIRVVYYWLVDEDNILMLVAYAKNVKDNLTSQETEILRKLVKEL